MYKPFMPKIVVDAKKYFKNKLLAQTCSYLPHIHLLQLFFKASNKIFYSSREAQDVWKERSFSREIFAFSLKDSSLCLNTKSLIPFNRVMGIW